MFSRLLARRHEPKAARQEEQDLSELTDIQHAHHDKDDIKFANGKRLPEIRRFEVTFERPNDAYFSGDTIKGEVRIDLDDILSVKGIIVRFVGEAYVNVPDDPWLKIIGLQKFKSAFRRNKVKPSVSGVTNPNFVPDDDLKATPADNHLQNSSASPAPMVTLEVKDTDLNATDQSPKYLTPREPLKPIVTPQNDRKASEDQSNPDRTPNKISVISDGLLPNKITLPPVKRKKAVKISEKNGAAGGKPSKFKQRTKKLPLPLIKRKGNSKFCSYEKYFDYKFYVFGHKYSSMKECLWTGSHAFPFQYTLPTKLPTSFQGRYGYVRYYCEVILERMWLPNVRRMALFTVSSSLDLNMNHKTDASIGGQRTTNFCFFCCKKGTIIVEARIKRRGHVPGECMEVCAEVINMSDKKVLQSSVKFYQVVTYSSSKGFRHKRDELQIHSAYRGEVRPGDSDEWDGIFIPIPPVAANYKLSEYCKMIDVDYRVDFAVEIEGEAQPMVIEMPVIIGTVPLQRVFHTLEPAESEEENLKMPIYKYNNLPAIFCDPCLWGEKNLEKYYYKEIPRRHEDGVRVYLEHETFRPHYITYHIRPPEPEDKDEPAVPGCSLSDPRPKLNRSCSAPEMREFQILKMLSRSRDIRRVSQPVAKHVEHPEAPTGGNTLQVPKIDPTQPSPQPESSKMTRLDASIDSKLSVSTKDFERLCTRNDDEDDDSDFSEERYLPSPANRNNRNPPAPSNQPNISSDVQDEIRVV